MNNFVAMCIFVLLGIQLHNEILAGCQNVNSHVVLLHIAKFPYIRVAPVFIPTGHKNACFLTVSSSVDLSDVVICTHPSCPRWPGYFFGSCCLCCHKSRRDWRASEAQGDLGHLFRLHSHSVSVGHHPHAYPRSHVLPLLFGELGTQLQPLPRPAAASDRPCSKPSSPGGLQT